MTTAYVVQVHTDKGAVYLNVNGCLKSTPKFFLSEPRVRALLAANLHHGYSKTKHSADTTIIVIRELESGLKDSKAEILGYGQFMELGSSSKPPLSNPKAIYKLRKADGKLVSFGLPRPKHGKIWNRAGDLRSHITQYVRNYRFPPEYAGASVIEILMGPDGVMPEKVNTYPALDFYIQSPAARKNIVHPDTSKNGGYL